MVLPFLQSRIVVFNYSVKFFPVLHKVETIPVVLIC